MALIIADICLSDIPAEARTQGKNGKWYTKICIADRKEKDQYDNTHTVYVNQTKEQREAKTPKHYVGNAKQIGDSQQGQQQGQQPPAAANDLGF